MSVDIDCKRLRGPSSFPLLHPYCKKFPVGEIAARPLPDAVSDCKSLIGPEVEAIVGLRRRSGLRAVIAR
jgi:hypothetical protein